MSNVLELGDEKEYGTTLMTDLGRCSRDNIGVEYMAASCLLMYITGILLVENNNYISLKA